MGIKKRTEDISPQSPSAKSTGNWGEKIAAEMLVSLGYAIVEQNWKHGHYEVDIIAQKGRRIVFVEVKTRKSTAVDPVEAVTPAQQRRIIRSADAYLREYDVPFEYQFDIIAITGTEEAYEVEHIADAFFPSSRH